MKKEAAVVSEVKNSRFKFGKTFRLDDGSYRQIVELSQSKMSSVDKANFIQTWEMNQDSVSAQSRQDKSYVGLSLNLTPFAQGAIIKNISLKTNLTDDAEIEVYEVSNDQMGAKIGNLNCIKGEIDLGRFIAQAQKGIVSLALEDIGFREEGERLELEYIASDELLKNQKYVVMNASGLAQIKVNILSGSTYETLSLFNLGGERFPLSLNLIYCSSEDDNHRLETGLSKYFYTNFHQICYKEDTNSEKTFCYIDAERIKHIFRPVIGDSSLWVDTQGTGLLLQEIKEEIKIFDQTGNYYLFDKIGRLTEIALKKGDKEIFTNKITYTDDYVAKIDTITDGMGRVANFFYGQYVTVSLENKEKVQMQSLESGMSISLNGLTGEDSVYTISGRISMTPDGKSGVSIIHSPNGATLNVEYDTNGRAKNITCENEKCTMNYGYLSDTVENQNGVRWTYTFDDFGEFESSFEEKNEEDYSVRYHCEDPCVNYEGTLSEKKEVTWENIAMTAPGTKTFDTVDFNLNVANVYALFSVAIRIEELKTQKPIRISLNGSSTELCSKEFTPESAGLHVIVLPFRYHNGDRKGLRLVYHNEAEGKITFLNACVTMPTHAVTTIASNVNTGDASGYQFQGKELYFLTKNTSLQVNGISYDYKVYLNDYLANERTFYTKSGNTWNMWVDNMRMMIADVRNALIIYESGEFVWQDSSEEYDFVLLSVNTHILSAMRQSHRPKDQKQFIRNGMNILSFMHQINVSYTRNDSTGVATANYTEDLFYEKYALLLEESNSKNKKEYSYTFQGYLATANIVDTQNEFKNIDIWWGYNYNYLTSFHSYYLEEELITQMEYDEIGNLTKQTEPNGFEMNLSYYSYGLNLESVKSKIGGHEAANYIKYMGDKVSSLENGNSLIYSFTYDEKYPTKIAKIVIGKQEYANLKYELNDGTQNNSLNSYIITYANKYEVIKRYDEYNRLVNVTGLETVNENLSVKECGLEYGNRDPLSGEINSQSKLTRIIDIFVDREINMKYNDYGNVHKIESSFYIDNENYSQTYTYDDRQRVSTESIAFGDSVSVKTEFVYETGNNADQYYVKKVTCSVQGRSISYESYKDNLDRLEREEIKTDNKTSLTKKITYAERTKIPGLIGLGTTNIVAKEDFYLKGSESAYKTIQYTYDKNGNIVSVTRDEQTVRYEYDEANRLIFEHNPILGYDYSYSYDAAGNLTSKEAYLIHSFLPMTGETKEYKYENPDNPDQLTSWGDDKFQYDECGNVTFYKEGPVFWTRGRLLKRYGAANFDYDYNGIRTVRTLGNEKRYYVTNGGNLLAEVIMDTDGTGKGRIDFFYNQNGIFGFSYAGVVYYYVKNLQGDIIEIRRVSDNEKVADYWYDAWGNHSIVNYDDNSIGDLNPFRYRGYYYDTYVKMYYLQTRWYDPEVGRFINLDQISYLDPETVNGLNLYAYCQNNPVMGYDPTGTVWWWLVGAIVGAVIGFVATVIEDFADDGKVFNGSVSAGEYVAKTAIGAGVGALGGEAFGAAGSVASSLAPAAVAEEAVAVSSAALEAVGEVAATGLIILFAGEDPYIRMWKKQMDQRQREKFQRAIEDIKASESRGGSDNLDHWRIDEIAKEILEMFRRIKRG